MDILIFAVGLTVGVMFIYGTFLSMSLQFQPSDSESSFVDEKKH